MAPDATAPQPEHPTGAWLDQRMTADLGQTCASPWCDNLPKPWEGPGPKPKYCEECSNPSTRQRARRERERATLGAAVAAAPAPPTLAPAERPSSASDLEEVLARGAAQRAVLADLLPRLVAANEQVAAGLDGIAAAYRAAADTDTVQARLAAVRADADAEVRTARAEAAEATAERDAALRDAAAALREAADADARATAAEHARDRAEAERAAAHEQHTAELGGQAVALHAEHARQLADQEKRARREAEAVRAAHTTELAELRNNHARELAALTEAKNAAERRHEEAAAAHAAELERTVALHERIRASLQSTLDRTVALAARVTGEGSLHLHGEREELRPALAAVLDAAQPYFDRDRRWPTQDVAERLHELRRVLRAPYQAGPEDTAKAIDRVAELRTDGEVNLTRPAHDELRDAIEMLRRHRTRTGSA